MEMDFPAQNMRSKPARKTKSEGKKNPSTPKSKIPTPTQTPKPSKNKSAKTDKKSDNTRSKILSEGNIKEFFQLQKGGKRVKSAGDSQSTRTPCRLQMSLDSSCSEEAIQDAIQDATDKNNTSSINSQSFISAISSVSSINSIDTPNNSIMDQRSDHGTESANTTVNAECVKETEVEKHIVTGTSKDPEDNNNIADRGAKGNKKDVTPKETINITKITMEDVKRDTNQPITNAVVVNMFQTLLDSVNNMKTELTGEIKQLREEKNTNTESIKVLEETQKTQVATINKNSDEVTFNRDVILRLVDTVSHQGHIIRELHGK